MDKKEIKLVVMTAVGVALGMFLLRKVDEYMSKNSFESSYEAEPID